MIDKNDSRLTDFVLGELSESDTVEIQNAIADSPELATAVDEIRQMVGLLGDAYQAEEPLRLLDDQKAALAQAGTELGGITELNSKSEPKDRAKTARTWLPIVLAASLLGVLVGGAVYLSNPPVNEQVAKRMNRFEGMDRDELEQVKDKTANSNKALAAVTQGGSVIDESNDPFAKLRGKGDATADWDDQGLGTIEKFVPKLSLRVQQSQEIVEEESASPMSMPGEVRGQREGGFYKSIDANEPGVVGDFAIGRVDDVTKTGFDREPEDSIDRFSYEEDPFNTEANTSREAMKKSEEGQERGVGQGEGRGMGQGRGGASPLNGGVRSPMKYPRSRVPVQQETQSEPDQSASPEGDFRSKAMSRLIQGTVEPDSIAPEVSVERMQNRLGKESEPAFVGDDGRQEQQDQSGGQGKFDENQPGDVLQKGQANEGQANDGQRQQVLPVESQQPQPGNVAQPAPAKSRVKIGEANDGIILKGDEENLDRLKKLTTENSEKPKVVAAKKSKNRVDDDTIGGVADGKNVDAGEGVAGEVVSGGGRGGAGGGANFTDEQKRRKQLVIDEASQLGELGIPMVTKVVTETKTRSVPVQRTRTETRSRQVTLEDGSVVDEKYEVNVPYTENLAQSYTVQVPRRYFSLEQGKSQRIVDQLTRKLDPNGKRELKLLELLESEVLDAEPNATNEGGDKGEVETGKLLKALKMVTEKGGLKGKTESGVDTTDLFNQLGQSLAKRNAEVRRTRTWKRVKAIPNTTRLMVGDKDELDLTGMQVNVQVDGFRARVLLDYFYYNDRAEQLEGNFKLRLPDDSSLYYFAFGESAYEFDPAGPMVKEEFLGEETQFVSLRAPDIRKAREQVWSKVKEARMVPKEKAAHAFRETVRRKIDPALVEWSGAGVFNARVFPLAPHKLHRIVIGYDVNLTKTKNGWEYQLDLPEQVGQCQVDLNVQKVDGINYQIDPKSDPYGDKIKGNPSRHYRFHGPQKNGIKLIANLENDNKEVVLVSNDKTEGEFFGVQVTPELPVETVAGNPRAVFLVDTSLSSNPDKFNAWLKLLKTSLDSNRDSLKQFNVLFFNVGGHFWQDNYVDNTPENVAKLMEICDTLALEGATDLYGAIAKISKADWIYGPASIEGAADASDKPVAGPDLFLLSDGAANWGETNLRLIGRQLNDHQLGSLFAYQTGLTGTSISSLRFLAGQSGGAVFSVATEDEIKIASTAHRKRPWKLESVAAAGTKDLMTAGRVQWVYPGQTITVVGRGRMEGELKLNLSQAAETKTVSVSPLSIESELASRLYGQVAVGQLESLGAKVFDVAASYARHFRVTGETCSLLMLESEADYLRFNIKPQEDLFVVKAKFANVHVEDVLKKSADQLADPKAQLEAWLERLETMPGMEFKMPTALKLVMEKINVVAVSKPLGCGLTLRGDLSDSYMNVIKKEKLDYDSIASEANRRSATSVDDAIKVYSSLVERNPGDVVIARDVAFTAMELGRPAQAYHLLRQVAQARPFEGSIYPALGQCLTQLGEADMALVYYEIALGGNFQRQGSEFKQIVSAEYMHLLGKIKSGEMKSSAKEFASARLDSLKKTLGFESANLVITMLWNTDQTDVDLHVIEPNGEECSYENKKTRSGGKITSDITTGFGPEMYSNVNAPAGKYDIKVKYYSNSQSRTELRNKVHLLIYRGLGTDQERLTRRTVRLKKIGDKESVATIGID